jgi:hypothetical protein
MKTTASTTTQDELPSVRSEPLLCCPHCGGVSGYYDRNVVSYTQFYEWDGRPIDASEMNHVRGGRAKYCEDCGKRVYINQQHNAPADRPAKAGERSGL